VRGAHIHGRLALDFLTDAVPLELVDCLLDHGFSAYAAHLPYLELRRCQITHPTLSALDARVLTWMTPCDCAAASSPQIASVTRPSS
jgi:hypothetical protein